jgi:5-methylcytosine-specific restriction protein A
MAVTHGHGNPKWTRDETILALDLYFDCRDHIPSASDERVQALSKLLRAFPYHSRAARKDSFRNPDGVAFKLQNLRQVDTGRGLGNVSKMDRAVWNELGKDRKRTNELANLIRSGIAFIERTDEELNDAEEFSEGRVVSEAHSRRERDPRLRQRLMEQRRKDGALECEICGCLPPASEFGEVIFEVHHLLPLAAAGERKTKLTDMALLCANCHRLIHRAIAIEKHWLSIQQAKLIFRGDKAPIVKLHPPSQSATDDRSNVKR